MYFIIYYKKFLAAKDGTSGILTYLALLGLVNFISYLLQFSGHSMAGENLSFS